MLRCRWAARACGVFGVVMVVITVFGPQLPSQFFDDFVVKLVQWVLRGRFRGRDVQQMTVSSRGTPQADGSQPLLHIWPRGAGQTDGRRFALGVTATTGGCHRVVTARSGSASINVVVILHNGHHKSHDFSFDERNTGSNIIGLIQLIKKFRIPRREIFQSREGSNIQKMRN